MQNVYGLAEKWPEISLSPVNALANYTASVLANEISVAKAFIGKKIKRKS